MRAALPQPASVLFLLVCSVFLAIPAIAQTSQEFLVTATHGAIIRAEPNTSSERVAVVAKDTILPVVAVENDHWVQVTLPATGQKGYIYRTLGFVRRAESSDNATPRSTAPAPAASAPPATLPPAKEQPAPAPAPASTTTAPRTVAQASQPTVNQQRTEPGPFGVGLQLGVNPGGAEPSVLYDLKKQPITIRGLFDFGSGWSAFGAQGLFRFQNKGNSNGTAIVPYVGGGLFLLNVDYGLLGGSQRFTGFLGSGGVFFTFHSLPSVRFSAEVNVPVYSYGSFGQPALSGIYFGVGGHYFFSKSR